jgi:hypothetical protein
MRLGAEGRALTTLAKEVSDLSQTTRTYMGCVTAAITGIVAVSGQAESRIQTVRAEQSTESQAGGTTHQSDISLLEGETAQFISLISEACIQARGHLADMDGVRTALQAIDGIEEKLEETLDALGSVVTTLSAAIGERLDGDGESRDIQAGDVHAERYTMEAERRIHRQLAGGHGAVDADGSFRPVGPEHELVYRDVF